MTRTSGAWASFIIILLSTQALVLVIAVPNAAAELYVVRVGDGVTSLAGNSTMATIEKFADNGGSPMSTINLPTAASGGNQPFTTSGSATSEGSLALSPNGRYLTMTGYAVAPGVPGIAATTSTAAPRAVARYELNTDVLDTSTVFSGDSTYSGNNIRSAVTDDGGRFWMGGPNQGVRYATHAATTSTMLINTATNVRVTKIFDGQLYVSSAVAPLVGISSVGTGLPTGTGQTATPLFTTTGSGTGSASPYDFFRKDANTFYVADDRTAVNGGGIQKWEFNSGTSSWGLSYTIPLGASGARGLSGAIVNENTVLYATSAESNNNHVFAVRDTGIGASATSIADAGVNRAFRGLSFVAPAKYVFTTIDYPGATASSVNNIDNSGRMVGEYEDGSGHHAYVLENGDYTSFDVPGAFGDSSANGINLSNQVVGWYEGFTNTKAYVRNGSSYTDLSAAPSGSPETKAYAINNAGHVGGYYKDPDNGLLHRGFFYNGNSYEVIHYQGAIGTEVFGINNSDQLVGYYADGQVPHGFIYAGGVYSTIDHPLGALGTVAQGINDAGDIVGIYFDETNKDHGFIKTSAGYMTVDFPGATFSGLVGINNAGQVVGYYQDATGFHGYLATPVRAADFNSDGHVDGLDLAAWKGGFGVATGAAKTDGDANGDFAVDGADFLKWQTQVTVGAASPVAKGVPEPAGLPLGALSAVGLAILGRRRYV